MKSVARKRNAHEDILGLWGSYGPKMSQDPRWDFSQPQDASDVFFLEKSLKKSVRVPRRPAKISKVSCSLIKSEKSHNQLCIPRAKPHPQVRPWYRIVPTWEKYATWLGCWLCESQWDCLPTLSSFHWFINVARNGRKTYSNQYILNVPADAVHLHGWQQYCIDLRFCGRWCSRFHYAPTSSWS